MKPVEIRSLNIFSKVFYSTMGIKRKKSHIFCALHQTVYMCLHWTTCVAEPLTHRWQPPVPSSKRGVCVFLNLAPAESPPVMAQSSPVTACPSLLSCSGAVTAFCQTALQVSSSQTTPKAINTGKLLWSGSALLHTSFIITVSKHSFFTALHASTWLLFSDTLGASSQWIPYTFSWAFFKQNSSF